MAIISSTGAVFLIKEPVSGRFGIHRLLAKLSFGEFKLSWDGTEEITVVTFNRRRTICKILHVDSTGVDCTTRILNTGTFKVMIEEGLIPERLSREDLIQLITEGTVNRV